MKGQGFVKVTSILMIIGGIISIIIGIVAILGVGALHATANALGASGTTGILALVYVALVLTIVASVVELIAGIKGVKDCKAPENAGNCMIWGIAVIALSVISNVTSIIGGNKIDFISIILGLAVPVLYVIGTVMMKNSNTDGINPPTAE